jgi:hypothetical protein
MSLVNEVGSGIDGLSQLRALMASGRKLGISGEPERRRVPRIIPSHSAPWGTSFRCSPKSYCKSTMAQACKSIG